MALTLVFAPLLGAALSASVGDTYVVGGTGPYAGATCTLVITPDGGSPEDVIPAAGALGVAGLDGSETCGYHSFHKTQDFEEDGCPTSENDNGERTCSQQFTTGGTLFVYVCDATEATCSSPGDILYWTCGSESCDTPSFGTAAYFNLFVPTHSESATQSVTPTQSQTATQTFVPKPPPGSVGDPILVDFAGHRFMGGARGRTEYLLYRSQDESEAITMTTGVVQGAEDGFFAVTVGVQRAGCGSLHIAAIETEEHAAEISGDACMTARVARGDEGLVLVPIGEGGEAGSVLAVYPHHQGDSPAFLNMRLLATTPEFRAGCTGMLCNEAHGDVEA